MQTWKLLAFPIFGMSISSCQFLRCCPRSSTSTPHCSSQCVELLAAAQLYIRLKLSTRDTPKCVTWNKTPLHIKLAVSCTKRLPSTNHEQIAKQIIFNICWRGQRMFCEKGRKSCTCFKRKVVQLRIFECGPVKLTLQSVDR